jgi:hypothetical protein
LDARPFVPFTVYLADGGHVRIPTLDHIHVFPNGRRVIVHKDNDDYEVLSPLMITRLAVEGPIKDDEG